MVAFQGQARTNNTCMGLSGGGAREPRHTHVFRDFSDAPCSTRSNSRCWKSRRIQSSFCSGSTRSLLWCTHLNTWSSRRPSRSPCTQCFSPWSHNSCRPDTHHSSSRCCRSTCRRRTLCWTHMRSIIHHSTSCMSFSSDMTGMYIGLKLCIGPPWMCMCRRLKRCLLPHCWRIANRNSSRMKCNCNHMQRHCRNTFHQSIQTTVSVAQE